LLLHDELLVIKWPVSDRYLKGNKINPMSFLKLDDIFLMGFSRLH